MFWQPLVHNGIIICLLCFSLDHRELYHRVLLCHWSSPLPTKCQWILSKAHWSSRAIITLYWSKFSLEYNQKTVMVTCTKHYPTTIPGQYWSACEKLEKPQRTNKNLSAFNNVNRWIQQKQMQNDQLTQVGKYTAEWRRVNVCYLNRERKNNPIHLHASNWFSAMIKFRKYFC